ncbi:hypothetical protein GBA52_009080 [Prunus armeniaca]|nr:hypothetical protein GBA52_009080 [Prunus armeniaca]
MRVVRIARFAHEHPKDELKNMVMHHSHNKDGESYASRGLGHESIAHMGKLILHSITALNLLYQPLKNKFPRLYHCYHYMCLLCPLTYVYPKLMHPPSIFRLVFFLLILIPAPTTLVQRD